MSSTLSRRKVKSPAKKGKLSISVIRKAVAKVSRERDVKYKETTVDEVSKWIRDLMSTEEKKNG